MVFIQWVGPQVIQMVPQSDVLPQPWLSWLKNIRSALVQCVKLCGDLLSPYFMNISLVALEPHWGYCSIDGNAGFSFGSSSSFFLNYNVNMVNFCSDAPGYLHCHYEYVVN